MKTGPATILLLLLPATGFIVVFLVAALVMTALQSLGLYSLVGESRLTLDHWTALLEQGFFDSLFFSLKVGIVSAFGTLLLAYPLSVFIRRRRFGTQFIGSIIKIPLFMPALAAAFLIVNVFAYHGILNSALLAVGIIDEPLRMLNDRFGWNVFIIQIWKNLPFEVLIISAMLATIPTEIEDAARNLGAGPIQVATRILLPLSMPSIVVAVVLVFIMTFGDYAITRVAGPVYPSSLSVLMHTKAFTLQQWAEAACIGVVLMVTSLAFVALYAKAARALFAERKP